MLKYFLQLLVKLKQKPLKYTEYLCEWCLLVESNELMINIPQNQELDMYSKRIEENNEDDDNPLLNDFNKIVKEKAPLELTLTLLESLDKYLTDKAKIK